MATKASAPFLELGNVLAEDLLEFLATHPVGTKLKPTEKKLLGALARHCVDRSSRSLTLTELSDAMGVKQSSVTVYAMRLLRGGVLRKYHRAAGGVRGRQPNIYVLNDLSVIAAARGDTTLPLSRSRMAEEGDTQGELFAEGGPSDPMFVMPTSEHKAEIFSTYTLLSALRLGNSGARAKGTFTTPIYVGPEVMRLRVAAVEGEKVAGILDTKALIALTTLARSPEFAAKRPDEPLVLDLGQFTTYMGYEDTGGCREVVWSMVNAWRQTSFQVLTASTGLQRLYGAELFEINDFSFISRLTTLVEGTSGAPLRFAVWFDPLYLSRIRDPSNRYLSAVDQEIMREKNPSRLLFYYWARRAVQYRTTPRDEPYTFEHLRNEMAPYMNATAFRATLRRALSVVDGAEHQVYAYRVRQRGPGIDDAQYRETQFEIYADPSSLLVRRYHRHGLPAQ